MNKVIIVAATCLGAQLAKAMTEINAEVITPEEAEARGLKPLPQINISIEPPRFDLRELGRAPLSQPQYKGYMNSRSSRKAK